MANILKITRFIAALLLIITYTACEDDDNSTTPTEPAVELTAGDADFSNYVSLGNSLTAGFTDNALFIAAQENSMPNLLSQKFALAGGGAAVAAFSFSPEPANVKRTAPPPPAPLHCLLQFLFLFLSQ